MKITMSKKGNKRVVLEQGVYTTGQKWYRAVIGNVTFPVENAMSLNMIYTQFLNDGYTVIKEKEPKVAAPKEPKPVKTRAEALTEKYGDIEVRRAYMAHKVEVIKAVKGEIAEWAKTHRRLSREEYKKCLNAEVAKRMSQYNAEMNVM